MNSDDQTLTISPPQLSYHHNHSTTQPPSKWLHRLRTSKGFPDSDHTNLQHFLSNEIDPPINETTPTKNISEKDNNNNENENGADIINNMLCELFYMGEYENPSRIIRKKTSRKQHCPRIYVVPQNPDVVGKVKVKVSLPVTLSGRRKVKVRRREVVEEEEERGDWDVSGYSQTEVTVIDTSVSDWKFDRVLYRKKNVWKVGDKKGKGLLMDDAFGNKRKESSDNENGDVYKKTNKELKLRDVEENDERKKKKKKKKKLKLCNSLNYVDKEGGATMVRMKSAQGHEQGKAVVAAYEKKQDNCNQPPEKSVLKKQIDGGSSVILIKSIPTTNKKDVSGVSKSYVKSMEK